MSVSTFLVLLTVSVFLLFWLIQGGLGITARLKRELLAPIRARRPWLKAARQLGSRTATRENVLRDGIKRSIEGLVGGRIDVTVSTHPNPAGSTNINFTWNSLACPPLELFGDTSAEPFQAIEDWIRREFGERLISDVAPRTIGPWISSHKSTKRFDADHETHRLATSHQIHLRLVSGGFTVSWGSVLHNALESFIAAALATVKRVAVVQWAVWRLQEFEQTLQLPIIPNEWESSRAVSYTCLPIRLLGAIHAGEPGVATIIEIIQDAKASQWLLHFASTALFSLDPEIGSSSQMPQLIEYGGPEVQAALIRAAGRFKSVELLQRLISDSSELEPSVLAELAWAASASTGGAAEPFLIDLLRQDCTDELNLTAANCLAEVGSRQAITALLERADQRSTPKEVAWAIGRAITQIQTRLGRPEPGRLSVADTKEQEGALSVADEEGHLSKTEPE